MTTRPDFIYDQRMILVKQHARWLVAPLLLGATAFAQDEISITQLHPPAPRNAWSTKAVPEVTQAINELLEQVQDFLREKNQPTDLLCEPVEAWNYPGKIEKAAQWLEALVGKRGWTFTSEGQLERSYAFTAEPKPDTDPQGFTVGGLIARKSSTLAFWQHCHYRKP